MNDDVILSQHPDLVATEVDKNVIILDCKCDLICQLNPTASDIWRAVSNPIRFDELCRTLSVEYAGADAAKLRGDVFAFVSELRDRGLVVAA